jgi:chromosome segregation ATPase
MMKTKDEFVISDLEKKIEDLENCLKEKDAFLSSVEGSLAEAWLQNEKQGIPISNQDVRIDKLSKELKETKTILEESTSRFSRESEALNMKIKAEAEKSFKLSETLKVLQDRCFDFATQCSTRLKDIFNSIRATSEEASHSVEDIPGALRWIEKEIEDLDKVIVGHGDFCTLVAARAIATTFAKAGCSHLKGSRCPRGGVNWAFLKINTN